MTQFSQNSWNGGAVKSRLQRGYLYTYLWAVLPNEPNFLENFKRRPPDKAESGLLAKGGKRALTSPRGRDVAMDTLKGGFRPVGGTDGTGKPRG